VENGYSGTDMVFRDYDSEYHFVSLMISTATEISQPDNTALPHRVISGFDQFIDNPLSRTVVSQIGHSKIATGSFFDASMDVGLTEQLVIVLYDASWPKLDHLNEEEFSAFRSVLTRSKALLWISDTTVSCNQCPQYALITGLARSLRLERQGLVFTTLLLGNHTTDQRDRIIGQTLQNTLRGIETGDYEPELLLTDGVLTIPRVYENERLNDILHAKTANRKQPTAFGDRSLNLRVQSPGLLESLCFEELEDNLTMLLSDELEIETRAVGVNFKDILVALGQVKDETFGTECSGIVLRAGDACFIKPGDKVIVCHLDTFRPRIRCKQSAVTKIPEDMTFVEASSIPTNFITAYRSLIDVARLVEHESVLIHAGAGGTGQAAIQVAQYCGAEVFVTVGSNEKKELLERVYGIPSERILFSRNPGFAKEIKRLTRGRGVDVVLNSLSGPSLLASWECVAAYGRFIEIGKRDIISRHNLPMFQFAQNVTFSAVDIAAMNRQRPELACNCLREVVKLFRQGHLKTVQPMKVFPIDQVEAAFRYLQSGKEAGKVVVQVQQETQVPVCSPF
jgi:NADPH:quinone reductase-like Zn-dependent oxidoreductase